MDANVQAPKSIDDVGPGVHMCYVFDNDHERDEVMGRFLAGGLRAGGRVGYFSDRDDLRTLRDEIRRFGVDVEGLEGDRVAFNRARTIYCDDGPRFDKDRMLGVLRDTYQSHHACCAGPLMVAGEMTWALEPGVTEPEVLVRYEQEVNGVIETHPLTAVCQYDARRFDGALLYGILQAHPMMVIRGQIVANPYYLPLAA